MDSHDRYVLAIAMLDGDRDARKILADLLEEQGERGLAQWARQGRNRTAQRISFALMLLPCGRAILTGAAFVENAYAVLHGIEPAQGCTLVTNRWLHGDVDNVAALADLCGRTSQSIAERSQVPFFQQRRRQLFDAAGADIAQLAEAIQCALHAEACRRKELPNLIGHWEAQARHCIRRAVEQSQRVASTNLDWQTEYLKQAFLHLLSPAEHPWPK